MTSALGVAHQSKKKQLQFNLLKTRTEVITNTLPQPHIPGADGRRNEGRSNGQEDDQLQGWTIHHVWKFQFGAAPQGQVVGLVYLIQ